MQNLPKWARKSVLGPDFDQFFRVEKKLPNTYSIKLHCITAQNFRPIWPYLGELWPKTTQKQPKIIFPVTKQTFGMSTCLTYMKLGLDMNHLNTFHLTKNEGGNQRAAGGASEKPLKNYMKLMKSWL